MNSKLRTFIIIFLFLLIGVSLMSKYNNSKRNYNKTYEGVVLKKYLLNNKGSSLEPRIIFYCPAIEMEIDVVSDNKVFEKIAIGNKISVELDARTINLKNETE